MNTIQKIIESTETVVSDAPHRCPDAIGKGDDWRQGDVYLFYLGTIKPRDAMTKVAPTPQLAPGTGQGSRHCLDSTNGVDFFRLEDANEYEGPVMRVTAEGRCVTHPEHGHLVDLRPGWWAVGYQRTGESEDRARRVRD